MSEKTTKMEEALCDFLDENSANKEERLEIIEDLLHCLNFERRLAMLTDEEMRHMCDKSLSPAEIKSLEEAPTKEKKEELFTAFARAAYFRGCAWADYLNGVTNEKPFTSAVEKEKA